MKYCVLIFFTIVFFSCAGGYSDKKDKILQDFDSINQGLEKGLSSGEDSYKGVGGFKSIEQAFQGKQGLYDSLEKKFAGGETIPSVSENKISFTNDFFITKGVAGDLLKELKDVKSSFLQNTKDAALIEKIDSLGTIPAASNRKNNFIFAYFYNTPPIAAITILKKIENDISNIENEILSEYLKQ